MRKIVGSLIGLVIFLGGTLRGMSDWIGRTTAIDDASLLWSRVGQLAAAVSAQPAWLFYGTCLILGALAVALLLPPEKLGLPPSKPKPQAVLRPLEAMLYLSSDSAWGEARRKKVRKVREGDTERIYRNLPLLEAFLEFQEKAQMPGTAIQAWGMPNGRGGVEEIPHTFWMANSLDMEAVLRGGETTQPYGAGALHHPGEQVIYNNVRIGRDGVVETWRPMGIPGRIAKWVRNQREAGHLARLVQARDAEQAVRDEACASPAAVEVAMPGAQEPKPKKPGLDFAYRKAVLQVSELKSSRQKQGALFTKADCYLEIKNDTATDLSECSAHILGVEWRGGREILDAPLHKAKFAVARHGSTRLAMVDRDLKDVVSRPPHLLILAGGRRWPLKDGTTYSLEIELRSEYEYPTLVKIKLDVPPDPEGAVIATLESQKPDDRP